MKKPKLTKAPLVARAYKMRVAVGLPLGQTPDYVLDVERGDERLRAELNQVRLASAECQDADPVAAHYMLVRGQ